MLNKFLKRTPLVLLALNFIACSFMTPKSVPSAADLEKEEQAVYAFFAGDGPVLIMQETNTNISKDDPEQSIEYIKSGLKNISQETLDSYLDRNAQPTLLSPDMELGTEYTLVTADDLYEITSQPNWGELLSEKYQGTHGYIIFSRVGFNSTLDQAVVYVGSVAGPLMGAGFYYLMEKKNGDWVIKEQVNVWIS
ncbi:MAG: hypothetical protein IPN96_20930 [Anaerolineales bacterium]|nr:hypothetical protein [Anaerolineales bacterium]